MILVGSSGKNAELGKKIKELALLEQFDCEIINLTELKLPLYTPSEEKNEIPQVANELASKIKEANALTVIAPEYNGSLPPVINNTIAWVSRTSKDWREAFNGKPCLIATHSGSGGAYVLLALRQQLSYIGANVIGRQVLSNYSRPASDESIVSCLKQL